MMSDTEYGRRFMGATTPPSPPVGHLQATRALQRTHGCCCRRRTLIETDLLTYECLKI